MMAFGILDFLVAAALAALAVGIEVHTGFDVLLACVLMAGAGWTVRRGFYYSVRRSEAPDVFTMQEKIAAMKVAGTVALSLLFAGMARAILSDLYHAWH